MFVPASHAMAALQVIVYHQYPDMSNWAIDLPFLQLTLFYNVKYKISREIVKVETDGRHSYHSSVNSLHLLPSTRFLALVTHACISHSVCRSAAYPLCIII